MGYGPTGYENKSFAEMSEEEKRSYHDGNRYIMEHLFDDENNTPKNMKDWLEIAIDRGMLYHPDGTAATKEEVAAMLDKVYNSNNYDEQQVLASEFMVVDHDPRPEENKTTYYPLIAGGNSVYVQKTSGLTEEQLDEKKKENAERADNLYLEQLSSRSPKELVDDLAANVQALNPVRSNAITAKLKELGLYQDLSYTTQDGAKREKGYVKLDGQIYLRGENTPATPEKFVRFIEGVQPPKKPSGFFSGIREWWHKNISKLDDFTKYEQDMKEYEITKYYTCVKAGLEMAKPEAVKEYENEAAVKMYLDLHFDDLAKEWNKAFDNDDGALDATVANSKNDLEKRLLEDNELYKFVDNPATQKYLSEHYGENFKIFGENGRKTGEVDADTKAEFIAAGEKESLKCKWGILAEEAVDPFDSQVFTAMDHIVKNNSGAATDTEFLKALEGTLREVSPISKHLLTTIPQAHFEQLMNFYHYYNQFHKQDPAYSIEMNFRGTGLLTKELEQEALNNRLNEWLKPLDELENGMSETEKAFFADLKKAFTENPDLAHTAWNEFKTIDKDFVAKMAPAVEQYAKVKDEPGLKDLNELGVLEVICHNKVFKGPFSTHVKEAEKKADSDFDRSKFWAPVDLKAWAIDNLDPHLTNVPDEQKERFRKDFLESAGKHPEIAKAIMKEQKTMDQEKWNYTVSTVAHDYRTSRELGNLGALSALDRTGIFSKDTSRSITSQCKWKFSNYGSGFREDVDKALNAVKVFAKVDEKSAFYKELKEVISEDSKMGELVRKGINDIDSASRKEFEDAKNEYAKKKNDEFYEHYGKYTAVYMCCKNSAFNAELDGISADSKVNDILEKACEVAAKEHREETKPEDIKAKVNAAVTNDLKEYEDALQEERSKIGAVATAPAKSYNEMSAEERLANGISNRHAMEEYVPISLDDPDGFVESESELENANNKEIENPQMNI